MYERKGCGWFLSVVLIFERIRECRIDYGLGGRVKCEDVELIT